MFPNLTLCGQLSRVALSVHCDVNSGVSDFGTEYRTQAEARQASQDISVFPLSLRPTCAVLEQSALLQQRKGTGPLLSSTLN